MSGRVPIPILPPSERINNFNEVVGQYSIQEAVVEAARCLSCYEAPCQKGCPSEVDIPTFIRRIKTKDFRGAMNTIWESNIFPGVCGRICPVEELCERDCVMKQMAEAIAIGNLQRFAADIAMRQIKGRQAKVTSKKKVAVIGAGPAGLAATMELLKLGHHVDVFEKRPLLGGLLNYGIPAFRLPKKISAEEIEFIQGMGAKFHTETTVKKIEELLRKGFDAVFIGIGACECAPLRALGSHSRGVYSGIDFLERIAKGQPLPVAGMRVGVVGGGDVAVDVARSAKRLGAKTVYIIYRRSFNDMPASKMQVKAAKEEGIEIILLASPTKILEQKGRVVGCECAKTRLTEPDETGRMKPVPISGSEFTLDLDLIIAAIGQTTDAEFVKNNPYIKLSEGLVVVDEHSGMTSKLGVFAGGDVVSGGATVVEAIRQGKRAARGIHEYLSRR